MLSVAPFVPTRLAPSPVTITTDDPSPHKGPGSLPDGSAIAWMFTGLPVALGAAVPPPPPEATTITTTMATTRTIGMANSRGERRLRGGSVGAIAAVEAVGGRRSAAVGPVGGGAAGARAVGSSTGARAVGSSTGAISVGPAAGASSVGSSPVGASSVAPSTGASSVAPSTGASSVGSSTGARAVGSPPAMTVSSVEGLTSVARRSSRTWPRAAASSAAEAKRSSGRLAIAREAI